ncbi:MAG: 30S ribosomal protein THX [Bacteroidetes bacterium]|nr:30S ribosomal protein THX [Bacteroidota bacterium]
MGKGDKKTAKGKRVMGSYGNTRPRLSNIIKKKNTEDKK